MHLVLLQHRKLVACSKGLPSTSQAMASSGEAAQAALAAKCANNLSSLLAPTLPIPGVTSPSVPSIVLSSCVGGVASLLSSSMNSFLTTGAEIGGLLLQGRPTLSMSTVVPSFVSTFANPLFSALWACTICRPVWLVMLPIVLLCWLCLYWTNSSPSTSK